MDNIFPSSSFTLQLNDFEPFDPSFVFQQHSLPPLLNPDVLFDHPPLAAEVGKERLPESSAAGNGGVGGDDSDKQRKLAHREIERRRRQEMATLYASLRNELPLEYLRGKRSISDHVREAVRYIEQKQKSIRELEAKRDKLKRDVAASDDVISDPNKVRISTRSEDTSPSIMVKIQSSREGVVEILINCGPSKLGFGVSSVLELLHEEGLDAVSCFCCRVEGNLLYSIQAEVRV
nr:transcription factor bHLH118-like [Ipomoea batatas]GME17270.1 transcription factor bHLH118-like [Ipomoea batatas]